jgi:uncharacterized Zn finger protein
MPRWRRILNRIRNRNVHPGTELHMCRKCYEDFVHPVTWTESGADSWWLLLRCGGCGSWRDVVATNTVVAKFDRVLDQNMESMNAEADRLERESLAGEADVLVRALQLDLLGAEDFRVQP